MGELAAALAELERLIEEVRKPWQRLAGGWGERSSGTYPGGCPGPVALPSGRAGRGGAMLLLVAIVLLLALLAVVALYWAALRAAPEDK